MEIGITLSMEGIIRENQIQINHECLTPMNVLSVARLFKLQGEREHIDNGFSTRDIGKWIGALELISKYYFPSYGYSVINAISYLNPSIIKKDV